MSGIFRRGGFIAVALCVAMLAAACGDAGESDDGSSAPGPTDGPDAATPKSGGTLTFGTFSEPRGLDPIVATGFGVTGGIELSAIYDTIVGYNPATKTYDMRTAESITPNSDFSEWTLKLKPDITFGDGTPYDAAAVEYNVERHKGPKNATTSKVMASFVESMSVTDPLTIRFTLTEPWSGFPWVLSDRLGMLVSPTAADRLGDELAVKPEGAGAGPFEIVSFTPREAIVMERKADYWGGDVYLDQLRFVNIIGAAETYEALKANTIQAAFLREPKVVEQALDEGYTGLENVQQASEIILINNGVEVTCNGAQPAPACTGQADGAKVATPTATSSRTVRQAIVAALDPQVIDDRVNDGTGEADSALFQSSFPWDPKVPGPAYDPVRAKSLVAQAKAEGWDGKVRLVCDNAPARQAQALAMQTMLQTAGIEVALNNDHDVTATITDVIVKKDFDLACWGINIPGDDGGVFQVSYALSGTSPSNRTGYKNAEMDAAISELKTAPSDDAKTAAFAKIATLYTQDVPFLSLQAIREFIAWDESIKGVTPNQSSQVFLDKAWIDS